MIQSLQGSDIDAVRYDLSAVRKDVATLKSLGSTPSLDPSTAIAAGKKALNDAANAISWANQQGGSINHKPQKLATRAQNYANSKSC